MYVCVRFNFCGVKLCQILDFNDFHGFIFVSGHVLPLHKSSIWSFAVVNFSRWIPIRENGEFKTTRKSKHTYIHCMRPLLKGTLYLLLLWWTYTYGGLYYGICNWYAYVRTYICVPIGLYVWVLWVHVHAHMYVCMYLCAYIHTYVRAYICMYVYIYVCTYIFIPIGLYVYTLSTYVCTYINFCIPQAGMFVYPSLDVQLV